MNDRLALHARALALAVVVTLGICGGMHGLAAPQGGEPALAATDAPVQTVVIYGQRLPRS